MDTKPLGNTGVRIPEIGYGTWNYKGDPATIHRAMELGATLIDSAEEYGTEARGRRARGSTIGVNAAGTQCRFRGGSRGGHKSHG